MTTQRDIRRCPFCGNPRPSVRYYKADGVRLVRDRYAVLCNYVDGGCGAESGWYHSPDEAIVMWNQRKRRWNEE